jgi:hypothetical protein
MVYSRKRDPVGCYLYYGRPGGIARVLQILALPRAVDGVVTNLIGHAGAQGCVAVRSRTYCAITACCSSAASTTVYSKNADLLSAIRFGDALIIGLAGEGWTRLIGEQFT